MVNCKRFLNFGGIKPNVSIENVNIIPPPTSFDQNNSISSNEFDYDLTSNRISKRHLPIEPTKKESTHFSYYPKDLSPKYKKFEDTLYKEKLSTPPDDTIRFCSKIDEEFRLENYAERLNIGALEEILRLKNRKNIELNSIKEDVELLAILMYDGSQFYCPVCKVSYSYASTMEQNHLKSVLHAKNISRLGEEKSPYHEILSNPFTKKFFETVEVIKAFNELYNVNLNKENVKSRFKFGYKYKNTLYKSENTVYLIHDSQSTIIYNNNSNENYFGEEFIKPVSGYHCTLCKVLLLGEPNESISIHLCGKYHQDKLKKYSCNNVNYRFGYYSQKDYKEFIQSNEKMKIMEEKDLSIKDLAINLKTNSKPEANIAATAVLPTSSLKVSTPDNNVEDSQSRNKFNHFESNTNMSARSSTCVSPSYHHSDRNALVDDSKPPELLWE